jgi:hypothetical protein
MEQLNKVTPVIVMLSTLLLAQTAIANTVKTHSFGAQLSGGSAQYKNSEQDGGGVAQLYLHYNYAFNEMFSLEVGLNGAQDADDWDCSDKKEDKFTCSKNEKKLFGMDADKLEYSNLVIAAKGNYALSQRNSLYGKLGVQFYDYEISKSKSILVEEDGVGLFLEAGWGYQWDNGLAVNVGIQSIDMGDLDTAGATIGMRYHF